MKLQRNQSRFAQPGTPLGTLLFAAALLVGCLGAEAPVPESVTPQVVVEQSVQIPVDPATTPELLPNATAPLPGVLSGGQPSIEQVRALAASGYTTIINTRLHDEDDFSAEIAEAEALGMTYVQIPVGGADDLTMEHVQILADAMDASAGNVAIHCRSGNRVGALLALKAAWIDQAPPEEAIEVGLNGGLTRLELTVRELLGLGVAG